MNRSQLILQVVEKLRIGESKSQCPKCRKKFKESYYSNQKLGICPFCQARLPEGSGIGTVQMGRKSSVPMLVQGAT